MIFFKVCLVSGNILIKRTMCVENEDEIEKRFRQILVGGANCMN